MPPVRTQDMGEFNMKDPLGSLQEILRTLAQIQQELDKAQRAGGTTSADSLRLQGTLANFNAKAAGISSGIISRAGSIINDPAFDPAVKKIVEGMLRSAGNMVGKGYQQQVVGALFSGGGVPQPPQMLQAFQQAATSSLPPTYPEFPAGMTEAIRSSMSSKQKQDDKGLAVRRFILNENKPGTFSSLNQQMADMLETRKREGVYSSNTLETAHRLMNADQRREEVLAALRRKKAGYAPASELQMYAGIRAATQAIRAVGSAGSDNGMGFAYAVGNTLLEALPAMGIAGGLGAAAVVSAEVGAQAVGGAFDLVNSRYNRSASMAEQMKNIAQAGGGGAGKNTSSSSLVKMLEENRRMTEQGSEDLGIGGMIFQNSRVRRAEASETEARNLLSFQKFRYHWGDIDNKGAETYAAKQFEMNRVKGGIVGWLFSQLPGYRQAETRASVAEYLARQAKGREEELEGTIKFESNQELRRMNNYQNMQHLRAVENWQFENALQWNEY